MIEDPIVTDDIVQGADSNLGPGYFAAHRFAEAFMSGVEAEHFKPVLEKVVKDIADALFDRVQDSFIHSVESNVQSHIWQEVDQIVRYLLAGTPWAVERYALGNRYNCVQVREAVARHVPEELQDERIADLEAEVASLKQSLEWARR
jgi:uncharacterized protein (UPF0297 family)